MDNTLQRLDKLESQVNALRTEAYEVLQKAYETAVDTHNEEDAKTFARAIRNKKLCDTDNRMTLDRLGLDTSSALKFLASLKNIFSNDWSKYRQHLRDLTKQEGFPFDIDWGEEPEE